MRKLLFVFSTLIIFGCSTDKTVLRGKALVNRINLINSKIESSDYEEAILMCIDTTQKMVEKNVPKKSKELFNSIGTVVQSKYASFKQVHDSVKLYKKNFSEKNYFASFPILSMKLDKTNSFIRTREIRDSIFDGVKSAKKKCDYYHAVIDTSYNFLNKKEYQKFVNYSIPPMDNLYLNSNDIERVRNIPQLQKDQAQKLSYYHNLIDSCYKHLDDEIQVISFTNMNIEAGYLKYEDNIKYQTFLSCIAKIKRKYISFSEDADYVFRNFEFNLNKIRSSNDDFKSQNVQLKKFLHQNDSMVQEFTKIFKRLNIDSTIITQKYDKLKLDIFKNEFYKFVDCANYPEYDLSYMGRISTLEFLKLKKNEYESLLLIIEHNSYKIRQFKSSKYFITDSLKIVDRFVQLEKLIKELQPPPKNIVSSKINKEKSLTCEYIERNCVDFGYYNNGNVNDTAFYYIKISFDKTKGYDINNDNSVVEFHFATRDYDTRLPYDIEMWRDEDKLYRPKKTFDSGGNYVCLPSLKASEFSANYVYLTDTKCEGHKMYLPMKVEDKLELEKYQWSEIIDNTCIYLILLGDMKLGDKKKDKLPLYISNQYRYRLRDYMINNKVRMIYINKLTNKVYYDKIF